jgi:hypothetical protein
MLILEILVKLCYFGYKNSIAYFITQNGREKVVI